MGRLTGNRLSIMSQVVIVLIVLLFFTSHGRNETNYCCVGSLSFLRYVVALQRCCTLVALQRCCTLAQSLRSREGVSCTLQRAHDGAMRVT